MCRTNVMDFGQVRVTVFVKFRQFTKRTSLTQNWNVTLLIRFNHDCFIPRMRYGHFVVC